MSARPVIVVGTSAGGVQALQKLVAGLPADLDAPVLVVNHLPRDFDSLLPQILARAGPLPAVHARDGERVRAGRIYCAVADHHLLLEDDRLLVKKGPAENRFRPSIDALFRSAAYSRREAVVGVVLTGMLNDGTSGLWTIRRLGGQTIVQDPHDALFPAMPESALAHVEVDYCLPLDAIAPKLLQLIGERREAALPLDPQYRQRMEAEIRIAAGAYPAEQGSLHIGEPSRYACPECHGVLGKLVEGRDVRFRCHTGHAYSSPALAEALVDASTRKLEESIRVLEEATLALETLVREGGAAGSHARLAALAAQARERARALHDYVGNGALSDGGAPD